VDYNPARYDQLKKQWWEQDGLIASLTLKIKCSVSCWKCLVECRLCTLIEDIRGLEDRLNGTTLPPADKPSVYSLFDKKFWQQRIVAQMQERVDRISNVLKAWEKPSATLGDVLDKNGKLIVDLPAVLAADPAKAIYDIFMTLIPRHLAIQPHGANSCIDKEFIEVCPCDKGDTDDCCGPDVGVRSLRDRLVGPLPYIVEPKGLQLIVCCLVTERLEPASDQLAKAQAELDATTNEIEQTKKLIADKIGAIETAFKGDLGNPIDCEPYEKKPEKPPTTPGGGYPGQTPPAPGGNYQGQTPPSGQTAS
jgi:hypothetical protein